jgi:hypothetical protein
LCFYSGQLLPVLLLDTHFKQNRASLVVLVHGDVEDDGKLVKALEHKADLIMTASGLSSGYSKEVNGQVLVLYFFPLQCTDQHTAISCLSPAMVFRSRS